MESVFAAFPVLYLACRTFKWQHSGTLGRCNNCGGLCKPKEGMYILYGQEISQTPFYLAQGHAIATLWSRTNLSFWCLWHFGCRPQINNSMRNMMIPMVSMRAGNVHHIRTCMRRSPGTPVIYDFWSESSSMPEAATTNCTCPLGVSRTFGGASGCSNFRTHPVRPISPCPTQYSRILVPTTMKGLIF